MSTLLATVIYKGEIIDLLKTEVNKKIKTKLEVDKIDLTLVKGFPNISIDFKGVKFYSSFEDEVLLESKNVYFVLNVFELFQQNIVVERVEIVDALINISTNQKGENNFDVFVVNDSSETVIESLSLKIVQLVNVVIHDTDASNNINNTYELSSLVGSLEVDENKLRMKISSSLRLTNTEEQQLKWLMNKRIVLNTKNEFSGDKVKIYASDVAIENVKLNLEGQIGIRNKRVIDIKLSTTNLKLKDLISIMPEKSQNELALYEGHGNINLSTTIKGLVTGKSWPSLTAQIALNDFEINHKSLPSPLKHINLKGGVVISNLKNLSSGIFSIEKLTANVDDSNVEISGNWEDFITPRLKGEIKGRFSTKWLLSFLNHKKVATEESNGEIDIDIIGTLGLNKSFELKERDINGTVLFDSVSISNFFGLPLNALNGTLIFDNQDINVEDLWGNYGNSNMLFNGVLSLPTKNKNRFYTKMEVRSTFVDLSEILTLLTSSIDSTSSNSYKNLKYSANLNFKVDQLTLLKFEGKNVEVNLTLDENIINVNTAFAKGMGGEIWLKGLMTEQFNGDHYVKVNAQTKKINIDSLFYVFGDFNQTFITSEAIEGKLDANVNAFMYFASDWSFRREMLYSEATLRVSKGKLIDYEPVMSLAEYLHEEGENLSKLSFSDLENRIIVANDTIFISEMNVGTNVRNIKIGGYHTLNQQIDYRLSVPVIGSGRDSDEQFGKVKTDNSGQLYFPFRVYGTTTDYKVVYDLKTARKNFVKGVKKGIKDIVHKPVIKNEDDSLKIEDDEYFDWDNR